MKSIAYLASAFLILTASMTDAASLYPEISDNSHASPEVAQILNDVFAAPNSDQHRPVRLVARAKLVRLIRSLQFIAKCCCMVAAQWKGDLYCCVVGCLFGDRPQ